MIVALVLLAFLALGPLPVAAQLVDVPPFLAIDGSSSEHFGNYRLAAGGDSGALVVTSRWVNDIGKSATIARRFAPTGEAIGGFQFLDGEVHAHAQDVYSDARGGYVTLWERNIGNALVGRLVNEAGAPTTPPFVITTGHTSLQTASGLPSGFVVVWADFTGIQVRLYDPAAQPLTSPPTIVAATFPIRALRVAGLSDGGFVVVWEHALSVRGQRYDAAGAPVGPVLALTDEFDLSVVAASPLGGFAVVGSRRTATHALPSGVWARRFDGDGAPLGPAFLVDSLDLEFSFVFPAAAYDPSGRLFVAWQPTSIIIEARGRAYDPAGRALHTPFSLADEAMPALVIAARPDGRFVEGWRMGNYDLRMQVQALCVPPFHTGCGDGTVTAPCEKCDAGPANSDGAPDTCRTTCALPSCGDGVVDGLEDCDDGNNRGCDGCDAECDLEPGYVCGDGAVSTDCEEQCDDGPGNDDGLPNACRTDCRVAHCGDGVLDDGEGCDDGNIASCDGCSDLCVPEPGLVCGDGIPELLCGEECDDGNAIVGDGCAAPCRLERIPGGGSAVSDCHIEWIVDNPANLPLLDKVGAINGVQTCTDGDPRCDFDTTAGTCTFHVRVCANNTDLPSCSPGSRLRSWELRSPSANKAAKRPDLAAVRAAFAPVPGSIVGPDRQDVCSDSLAVPIKVKTSAGGVKAGSLVLKSYATLYTGEKDSDKLRLICRP